MKIVYRYIAVKISNMRLERCPVSRRHARRYTCTDHSNRIILSFICRVSRGECPRQISKSRVMVHSFNEPAYIVHTRSLRRLCVFFRKVPNDRACARMLLCKGFCTSTGLSDIRPSGGRSPQSFANSHVVSFFLYKPTHLWSSSEIYSPYRYSMGGEEKKVK